MAIPTKTTQPSMGKVASRPTADLQTRPNTGPNTSQKTGEMDLSLSYHRLDIFPLLRHNPPSLLYKLAPIPSPNAQSSTDQSQMLHPFQWTPSTRPPWWQHTNQIRRDPRTGSQNHGNFTPARHPQSRHHSNSLEPPDKYKWRHSAAQSPGYQEWNGHSIQQRIL